MASKGIGKIFEEEIKKSFPEDFYIERYKDDTAGFYGVSNPADYRLYKYSVHISLRAQNRHNGKSLPLIRSALIRYRAWQERYYIRGFMAALLSILESWRKLTISQCRI